MISDETVERAVQVLAAHWRDMHTNGSLGRQRMLAEALHEAGLLAPAPLREEWGSEMHNARPESGSHVLRARDRDNARWQIEHNPEWATGRIVRRYVSNWEES